MLKELQKRLKSPDSFVSLILGIAVVLVIGTLVYNYFNNRTSTQTPNPEQSQITLPTTHTVAAGETLWTIAEKYYNSGYNWVDIAGANGLASADDIEVGQTLTIPVATPMVTSTEAPEAATTVEPTTAPEMTIAPTPTESPAPTAVPTLGMTGSTSTEIPAGAKSYTVVSGANLWNIAVAQYGDGYKWVEIAKANSLVNPNLIHPGNVFVLP